MPRFSVITSLAVTALLLAAHLPLEADDPVGTSVTFNREIIRIIQRKCEPCHAPGGLAVSLADYRDVRAWGRAIREELVEHRMPPAMLARGYGEYETDPSLNTREMATFLAWLDGGMPRGDDADRPVRSTGPEVAADPDGHDGALRMALPEQTVPAGEDLVVRRVIVDAGPAAGQKVARVQIRPGNPRVLRGASVFITSAATLSSSDAPRMLIGAWVPWQHAIVPPPSYAFTLPTRASFVVDLYYRGSDAVQVDRTALDVVLSPDKAAGSVTDVTVGASEQTSSHVRGRLRLREATRVWAIHPAVDASVSSLELRAERPDGSVDVLLWVPAVRPEWPLALALREPLSLPAGTVMSFVAKKSGAPAGTPVRVAMSVLR